MKPVKKEVLIVLTEQWNDWEASYAIAIINSFSDYQVKTMAVDKLPKKSMGGISAAIDYVIKDGQDYSGVAMVILPGGLSWEEKEYSDIAVFVREIMKLHIPIAAICGAATFLCKHGFLNDIKHTGDSLALFREQKEYRGEVLYMHEQVVKDNHVITANETAAVQFAYEIFKVLEVDTTEEIEQWYEHFKNGAVR